MEFPFEVNTVRAMVSKISYVVPGMLATKATVGGLLAILLIIGSSVPSSSQSMYTIYLVRHAEKAEALENPQDPELSPCGQERAESLAAFLHEVHLDVIYSSDYVRTRTTAEPTATAKSKEIEIYNPRDLETFAESLMERSQDALVVGHSNTTGVLAGLLVGEEIAAASMDEDVYNRIYQVVVCGDLKQLNLFQSTKTCAK